MVYNHKTKLRHSGNFTSWRLYKQVKSCVKNTPAVPFLALHGRQATANMARMRCPVFRFSMAFGLLLAAQAGAAEILLDPASAGQVFEGIGALSAGASSRLLMEYPEPARSQVLDLLFKPKFGATFHHLKVEIGGDVNSTDGTEPSHARTRKEFDHPKREYFTRGYEWWLMREARHRQPGIILDALQWGAPAWIGQGRTNNARFYSQDNADFIVAFLKGARRYHGVEINYCGIWNETPHDPAWIKLLRRTLDGAGLGQVQIVASDEVGKNAWSIAKEMQGDKGLMAAAQVIGAHYPKFQSPPEARATGKRLWASEDGPWRGDWEGGRALARAFNRNYVQGRMTKTIIWSLITSYYDTLPLPDSGPMMAKEPWSGHFIVQPALWIIAHTTQFAQPGWQYVDSGCLALTNGGSCVALRHPKDASQCSLIIETMDAKVPQTLHFRALPGWPVKPLHVWRSNERSQFERLEDLRWENGACTLTVDPDAVYSLTTTSGQKKGSRKSPPKAPFPLPYTDGFESSQPGKYARYFSDQGGVFEVTRRPDGKGKALGQLIASTNIDWHYHPTPEPYSLIGSPAWSNVIVTCETRLDYPGAATLWARVASSPQTEQPAKGYWLRVGTDGRWALKAFTNTLAEGQVAFTTNRWQLIGLMCLGPRITAWFGSEKLVSVTDLTYRRGQAGIGTGWNQAWFDNFSVQPISGLALSDPSNLAKTAQATASSQWDDQHAARFAHDGDGKSRWNAAAGRLTNEWLVLDFGQATRFNTVRVQQFSARITEYKLQYLAGDEWRDAVSRACKDEAEWLDTFPVVESRKLRLLVVRVSGNHSENHTPALQEMEVFDTTAPLPVVLP
jgi:galactosylceramidase